MSPSLRLDVRFELSTDVSPFHVKETANTCTHKPGGVNFQTQSIMEYSWHTKPPKETFHTKQYFASCVVQSSEVKQDFHPGHSEHAHFKRSRFFHPGVQRGFVIGGFYDLTVISALYQSAEPTWKVISKAERNIEIHRPGVLTCTLSILLLLWKPAWFPAFTRVISDFYLSQILLLLPAGHMREMTPNITLLPRERDYPCDMDASWGQPKKKWHQERVFHSSYWGSLNCELLFTKEEVQWAFQCHYFASLPM